MEKVEMNGVLLKNAKLLGYVGPGIPALLQSLGLLTLTQRYGESGRRNPAENAAIWEGLSSMLEKRQIKPVIYETRYRGLESVSAALGELAER
jgi:NADPH:quinone reductase